MFFPLIHIHTEIMKKRDGIVAIKILFKPHPVQFVQFIIHAIFHKDLKALSRTMRIRARRKRVLKFLLPEGDDDEMRQLSSCLKPLTYFLVHPQI